MMLNFWKTIDQGTPENYFELGEYLHKLTEHLNSITNYQNGFDLKYNKYTGYQQNQGLFGGDQIYNTYMKNLLLNSIVANVTIKNQTLSFKPVMNHFSGAAPLPHHSPFLLFNRTNPKGRIYPSNPQPSSLFSNQNSNTQQCNSYSPGFGALSQPQSHPNTGFNFNQSSINNNTASKTANN